MNNNTFPDTFRFRTGDRVRVSDFLLGTVKRTGYIVEVELDDGSVSFYGCKTIRKA